MVLHAAMHHEVALARGSGDRCGSGVGLQVTGGLEPVAVVTDLRQDPGAGEGPSPGKLVMIWAAGCCWKTRSVACCRSWAATTAASSRFTMAEAATPKASSTGIGW